MIEDKEIFEFIARIAIPGISRSVVALS